MRVRRLFGAILALLSVCAGAAHAQGERAIRLQVPFATGGGTDIHLRLMGEGAGRTLGQPILVDSRPGAAAALCPGPASQRQPSPATGTA